MVSLDARPAALAGLDSGELLFFAVKLLDLPAEAGRFLHGLGGELRGVVGDHIIRTLGGKRQAEQFQLMPLGEAPQVDVLARKLILGAPGERVHPVVVAPLPGLIDEAVALEGAVVEFLERLDVEHQPLRGVPTVHQHGLEVELLVMHQVVEHLLDVVELGLVVAAGIVDAVVDDPELLRCGVDIDAVDDPDAPDHRLGVAAVLTAYQIDVLRVGLVQHRVIKDDVARLTGHDLAAHVLPEQPGGDPLPCKVAVGQIVAEAPGVLGKVRQRVVDLRTQQKLAVVQTGNA